MSRAEDDLRATADFITTDADRLAEIETQKHDLEPGDPRLVGLSADPVRHELHLLLRSPLANDTRTARQVALQNFSACNARERFVPVVLDVDVRRRVFILVHPDVPAEKVRDDRHFAARDTSDPSILCMLRLGTRVTCARQGK